MVALGNFVVDFVIVGVNKKNLTMPFFFIMFNTVMGVYITTYTNMIFMENDGGDKKCGSFYC